MESTSQAPPADLQATTRLRMVVCPKCGATFAMARALYAAALAQGRAVFCPAGCATVWPAAPNEFTLAGQVQLLSELADAQATIAAMQAQIGGRATEGQA